MFITNNCGQQYLQQNILITVTTSHSDDHLMNTLAFLERGASALKSRPLLGGGWLPSFQGLQRRSRRRVKGKAVKP